MFWIHCTHCKSFDKPLLSIWPTLVYLSALILRNVIILNQYLLESHKLCENKFLHFTNCQSTVESHTKPEIQRKSWSKYCFSGLHFRFMVVCLPCIGQTVKTSYLIAKWYAVWYAKALPNIFWWYGCYCRAIV